MENKEKKELNPEELDQASGGHIAFRHSEARSHCRHEHKTRTGNEKEDSFFVFWSRHKYEYYCQDCEQNIWLTE